MIAHDKIGDTRADFFDDTRTFVAEHHGQRSGSIAIDYREVGVAEACCLHLDEYFAGPGRRQIDIGDLERAR
jgi:hypothetical protein